MPRKPRMDYEGAFHHIFSRGNRRERIFWNEADYAKFEEFMIEAMNWSRIQLYSWCLMPNHFHMLLQSLEANLDEFMRRLLTRYAKYFNWTHKLVGHVFQSRFKSVLCDKETYFMELVRYIHLNPYRTKRKDFATLGSWKWSSHRFYVGQGEMPEGMQQPIQEVLERFDEDRIRAHAAYGQFLADGLEQGTWEDFYQVKGQVFLGDETFIERTKRQFQEPVRQAPRSWAPVGSVEALGDTVARVLQIPTASFTSGTQKRCISRARQAMAYIGRRFYRFPATEIADYLGRDVSAISQMLARLKGREELSEIRKLTEELSRNGR